MSDIRPCTKVRHLTEADAERHRVGLKARENKKQGNRLHVYACVWCQGWHVGHDRYKGRAKRYSTMATSHKQAQN